MKANLAHLLRQAADAINPRKDHGAYAYMLEQVADHIDEVKAGNHTLGEFAEFYGMTGLAVEGECICHKCGIRHGSNHTRGDF